MINPKLINALTNISLLAICLWMFCACFLRCYSNEDLCSCWGGEGLGIGWCCGDCCVGCCWSCYYSVVIWLFSFVSYRWSFEYLANELGLLYCSIVDSIYCFLVLSYFSWVFSGDYVCYVFSCNYYLFETGGSSCGKAYFFLRINFMMIPLRRQKAIIRISCIVKNFHKIITWLFWLFYYKWWLLQN